MTCFWARKISEFTATLLGRYLSGAAACVHAAACIPVMYRRLTDPMLCSLTDPPQANETITAQMSLRGDLPGNTFNPVKNITLSRTAFNFTTDNCCTNAQPLEISSSEPLVPYYRLTWRMSMLVEVKSDG